MKRFFFLQVAIVLTSFQSEKSQNKLNLMKTFFAETLEKTCLDKFFRRQSKKVTPQ